MQAAVMKQKGKSTREVSASAYANLLRHSPGLAQKVDLFSPERLVPVHFRPGGKTMGGTASISPHFACAAGHGVNDHIFDRVHQTQRDAVRDGKLVVLSLNVDFTNLDVDFRGMRDSHAIKIEDWLDQNQGNYVSISARSAAEAIRTIRAVKEWAPRRKLNDTVFALYRGALLPYDDFFLNNTEQKLTAAFDGVHAKQTGVAIGSSRSIGFPRLFRFIPSKTTLDEEGKRGLKGNPVRRQNGHLTLLSQLVFEDENIRATRSYTALWKQISGGQDGVYVLACPSVSIETDRPQRPHPQQQRHGWEHMRWVVNDIDAQTAEAGIFGERPVKKPAPTSVPTPA